MVCRSEAAEHPLNTWITPPLNPVRPKTPNYGTRYFIIFTETSLSWAFCHLQLKYRDIGTAGNWVTKGRGAGEGRRKGVTSTENHAGFRRDHRQGELEAGTAIDGVECHEEKEGVEGHGISVGPGGTVPAQGTF